MQVQKRSPADIKIGVRPSTREKFDRFAKETRLKLVDIADLAIDELLKKQSKSTRRGKAGAT